MADDGNEVQSIVADKLEPFCIAAVEAVRESLLTADAQRVFGGDAAITARFVMFKVIPTDGENASELEDEKNYAYLISAGGKGGSNERFFACIFLGPDGGVDAKIELTASETSGFSEEAEYLDVHADTPEDLVAAIKDNFVAYIGDLTVAAENSPRP